MPHTPVPIESVTRRELQTPGLRATELTPDEIAGEMGVSTATVRTHINHIYGKLSAHSRVEAVQHARELGTL